MWYACIYQNWKKLRFISAKEKKDGLLDLQTLDCAAIQMFFVCAWCDTNLKSYSCRGITFSFEVSVKSDLVFLTVR